MKKTLLLLTFFLLTLNGFSQADLKISNTDYKTYYDSKSTNTYTITIVNMGPLDAVNVSVSDAIPMGITNFSWSGPGGKTGLNKPIDQDITPTLPAGQALTYVVTLSVPLNFKGDLKNEVVVTSSTPDPTPDCPQCVDIDTKAGADIVVKNSDNSPYYTPGTTVTYTLSVTNNGPIDAANVKVSDPFPSNISKFSWTGSNGSAGYDVPLNNTIPVLKNGETVTYTVTIDVPTGYTGDLTNLATVTSSTPDPNPDCTDCKDTDTLLSGADIVVTNTDNKVAYTAGAINNYIITVQNKGPESATNVSVTNTLPAGINAANVSWQIGNGPFKPGFLNDNIATLAAGQSITYTVKVDIPTTFVGNLGSVVSATSATPDPFPDSNQATDTDIQTNATDIVVTNSDFTDVYSTAVGSTTVYTVTVTNNGPIAATNVKVTEVFSNGINPTDVSWKLGSGVSKPGFLNDTITNLAIGQTVTYTVTLNIPTNLSGDLTNEIVMTSSTIDSSPVCDQCKDTDRFRAGVVVVNSDSQSNYTAGRTNTYKITVTNNEASPVNVAIKNPVPTGINQADFSWSGNNRTGTGDLIDTITSLAPNQSIIYTIIVKIPANYDQKTNLVSEVTYSVNGVPNTAICTQCRDTDVPAPSADLQIIKTDNQQEFYLNSPNTYTIVIANNGPSVAKNVVVLDQMPNGITSMTWSGSTGSRGTGTLNDTIPTLAVGEVVTYVVTIQVPKSYSPPDPTTNGATVVTNLKNVVKVTSDTPDPSVCQQCVDSDSPRVDYVTVDVNRFTAEQLVTDVLVNSPCVNISNFTSSASCGFGYFNKNNSNFPFKEGMLIRCGNAKSTEGKFTNTNATTTCSGVTDTELQAINCNNNKGNCAQIQDASFVKFNFVAGSDTFSFRYLLASEEYGEFQCGFSDAFAFILTDLDDPTAKPHNLAVIPNTANADWPDGLPVSVTNVRQHKYNSNCLDNNPTLFDQYNSAFSKGTAVGDPTKSAINMMGQTTYLTASSSVIAGHNYSIKLVIGDYKDSAFDSTVFIEAGSFKIAEPEILSSNGVKDNLTLCEGTPSIIHSGSKKIPGVIYSWKLNGELIPGADDYALTITKPGLYTVIYTYQLKNCQQSDDYTVVLADVPPLQEPNDLYVCEGDGITFDLSKNVPTVLGTYDEGDYDIRYFHSQKDASQYKNGIVNYDTYPGTDGEEIFMTLEYQGGSSSSSCVPIKTFKLHRTPAPTGTFQYVSNDGTSAFCKNSSIVDITKSSTFVEGGSFSASPDTGLTINTSTGAVDLASSAPGNYVVNYKIPAGNGCLEYNTTNTISVIGAPDATVSLKSGNSICMGEATDVVFNGTPGSVVTYTKNLKEESVTLNSSGQKILGTGVLNEDVTYNITSVTSSAAACIGYPTSSVTVDVVVIPEPALKQKGYICIDPTTGETSRKFKLDTALDPSQYTFEWYYKEEGQAEQPLSSTENYYDCDKVGDYRVVVTDNGPLHCHRTAVATVLKSVPPTNVVGEVVTGSFEDNATVVVTAAPMPPVAGTVYEYQLDYGPYQESNVFTNVSYGKHTVRARDKENCPSPVSAEVTVIDFPRFFTPNGDGYNDDWNISVLSDQPNSKIYIFDRFGKLIKQISPQGPGWDGTSNGRPLPADDYWFVVKYQEQLIDKEFKAHFSLKR